MRKLTEKESNMASELLTQRKPMYIGQKTWINYHKESESRFVKLDEDSAQAKKEEMLADIYSIEFVADRARSGALVWVPSREIHR